MLTATITIEGNRGEGKTTLAIMLIRMLEADGHTVVYRSHSRVAEKGVMELSDSGEEVSLDMPCTIHVVDVCSNEERTNVNPIILDLE